MLMKVLLGFAGSPILGAALLGPPSAAPTVLHASPAFHAEIRYTFACQSPGFRVLRATMRISNEHPRDGSDRSVAFHELSTSLRTVGVVERQRIAELIASFAWVENVLVRCHGRELLIDIYGMPIEWNAYISERIPDQPTRRRRTIAISRAGPLRVLE